MIDKKQNGSCDQKMLLHTKILQNLYHSISILEITQVVIPAEKESIKIPCQSLEMFQDQIRNRNNSVLHQTVNANFWMQPLVVRPHRQIHTLEPLFNVHLPKFPLML